MLLLIVLIIGLAESRNVHITLRQNITQMCPGVKSDIVDKDSIRFAFDMLSGSSENQVTVTDLYGNSKSASFPGCFRVRMSFRVTRPLKNPYIEAFLQLGTNIPCQSPKRSSSIASNICTNVTDPTSWCPTSTNERLRGFLKGKQTCQFCNLCSTLDKPEIVSEIGQSIVNEGEEQCDTESDRQTIQFRMCTPTEEEIRRKHPDAEDKLNDYWKYLKQGVLTAVVHVMDRSPMESSKINQCKQLCNTYEKKRGVGDSYKSTLLKSIDKLCAPQDEYAACVYHTLKFDLSSDF